MRRLLALLVIVFFAGCMTVKTYTIEKPRVDTDIEGNRGYLAGEPEEEAEESRLGDTRKVSVVEVEFGSRKPKGISIEDKEETYPETVFEEEAPVREEEIVYTTEEGSKEEYSYYTVKNNDTLQKISHKFYGTTRKWKSIYKANKNVIKNPDRVYPGIKLRIPK